MNFSHLSSTIVLKTVSEDTKSGVFEIEGLYAGYGLTLGNALRRTLLSSLPGAAITYVKIKSVPHEYSTLPGVQDDIVEIILNLKKIRFHMDTNEPQVLVVSGKGEKTLTAADIETNAQVSVINPESPIATLTAKTAVFEAELTVERGLGYSAVESRKVEKLAVGVLGVDAFFSPVVNVNFVVQDMRVGDRTDYNKLRLEVETDGTISPSNAVHKAANVLRDHFEKVGALEVQAFEAPEPQEKEKKTKTTRTKKA